MKYDFDLLTIGLGPSGMCVAGMGQAMGLRVGSIEKHKIGGECMNVGCIPSKALLRIAKTRHSVTKYEKMSLKPAMLAAVNRPFEVIKDKLDYIREKKNKKMFEQVKVILGEGSAAFIDAHTVEAGGKRYTSRNIFICTGTKPALPELPGLDTVDYLTNANVFDVESPPTRMLVIGGGAIACEMAQGFARLGSQVTMVIRADRLFRNGDPEAIALLEQRLTDEGVVIKRHAKMKRVSQENGIVSLELEGETLQAEKILFALGRAPEFTGLGLETIGIEKEKNGYIKVDPYLRTNIKNIYAVGDCNGFYQFSHSAMHQGILALINCMAPWPFKRKFKNYVVPYTLFTEPQISWVGETEDELKKRGVKYHVVRSNYRDYGAAIAEHIEDGWVKALTDDRGRLYGAGVVGEGSADMINEWGLAIQKKLGMMDILFLQHSFPSMGFLNKRVSESWMQRLMEGSPFMQWVSARMV